MGFGRAMERNRWETALRCLEIAVHPNTSDEEVIAAVNGFRRTANRTPLAQLYREGAGGETAATRSPATDNEEQKQVLDRLSQENRELQQRLEAIEDSRASILRQLREAEQRAHEIGSELFAAEHRAKAAEQRLAAFETPYGRPSLGLQDENLDMPRALREAHRNLTQPIHEPVRPFQSVLNAALGRPDQAPAAAVAPAARHPWTA